MCERHAAIAVSVAVGLVLFCSSACALAHDGSVPDLAEDKISVMFRHGVVRLPNELAPAALDSVAFALPEMRRLLQEHGVIELEKVFKGFAPHDTLRQARTGEMVRVIDLSQIFLVRLRHSRSEDDLVRALQRTAGVVFAERLPILEPAAWYDLPANDAMLENDNQWGLFNTGTREGYVRHADIDIKRAWQLQKGSEDILLGVIDTGVCFDHPDLSPDLWEQCFGLECKVVGGVNFLDPDECYGELPYGCCVRPDDDHGTKVAAAAVGLSNNWELGELGTWDGGVAGVGGGWYYDESNYDLGSLVLAYRTVRGPTYVSGQAVDDAVLSGADVINMSFTASYVDWKTLWYPMINAFQQGVTMVAGMGNCLEYSCTDPEAPQIPAAAELGVIAVGASNFNDQRVTQTSPDDPLWESMYGPHIDVLAPGRLHWSADALYGACASDPPLTEFGGTSCAAALTSGVACLLLSENPLLSNEEVEGIICASAKDLVYEDPANGTYAYLGWDEETGWGRVNAFQALMRLRSPYDLHVRWAHGYDTMVETNVEHILGESGSRQKFVQYRLTKTVPLLSAQFTGTPDVWGLSRMSSGACSTLSFNDIGDDSLPEIAPELVMGHCKLVNGSVTDSECTFKTFYYEWFEEVGSEWVLKGWIPTDPGLVSWAYELSGVVLDPSVSTCAAITLTDAPDSVPCLCPAGDQDSLAVKLHLVDNFGQPLAGVPSTDVRIRVRNIAAGLFPMFPANCGAYSESSYVFHPEEFIESDENGDLVIPLPPVSGPSEWALWTARVSGVDIGGDMQPVRSVDMDADGDVDSDDLDLFVAAYGAEDWAADLNGDGNVSPSDLGLFASHLNHDCLSRALAHGDHDTLDEQPSLLALLRNTPNPFVAPTEIAFTVADAGHRVSIRVYDLRGRLVRTLCDDEFEAGLHEVLWDGRSESGSEVASGVYFFRMESQGFNDQRKLVLLR